MNITSSGQKLKHSHTIMNGDIVLPIEWDILDSCNGFAFDMGGSVFKLAYISKHDWKEPSERQKGSKGNLHLCQFPRENIDDALKFIKENVKLNDNTDTPLDIYCTGYGGQQYSQRFKAELNANNIPLYEFDCSNHGFHYVMKNYPSSDIIYKTYKPAFQEVKKEILHRIRTHVKNLTDSKHPDVKYEDLDFPETEDIDTKWSWSGDHSNAFPCAVMTCGSGHGFTMMQSDGSYSLIDGSYRGGKMFLGLGGILTGAQGFDELMNLCQLGDHRNVSLTTHQITSAIRSSQTSDNSDDDQKNNIYKSYVESKDYMPDTVLFPYAHGHGKSIGYFKKEDLARCLLETHCLDLVQVTHYLARLENVKDVFFSGGFVNHPLVREIITVEWLRRDYVMRTYRNTGRQAIKAHFLIHGQYLGAIGAFLNYKLQWKK